MVFFSKHFDAEWKTRKCICDTFSFIIAHHLFEGNKGIEEGVANMSTTDRLSRELTIGAGLHAQSFSPKILISE